MNNVFRGMIGKYVLVYMDDILIFSKTREAHLTHIEEVLHCLRSNHLSAKFKKCQFFKDEVKFLGHIVSARGVQPDGDKVQVVMHWPIPKTQTEVKGFLGLTNYFRKFIKSYAALVGPLNDLTKKELGATVLWTPECQHAFELLKQALINAPILAVPDFAKPFTLVTDASQVGLGGVLLQDSRAVAFESRKFQQAERNYSTSDRELLAVIHCLKKWRVYMMYNPANEVVTDHKPNTTIDTKMTLSGRQVRWMEFLQEFNFVWKYEKGATNIADPLSRMSHFYLAVMTRKKVKVGNEEAVSVEAVLPPANSKPTGLQLGRLFEAIKGAYATQPVCQVTTGFTFVDGMLFDARNRIVVPKVQSIRKMIMHACHDDIYAGHMGKHKTRDLLTRIFWWSNVDKDIAEHVRHCHTCQTAKSSAHGSQGLLQPLCIPDRPWWSVSVDFITGLPKTVRGHDAILTVVDRLTRLTHVIPTTTTCDATEFAYLFKKEVIAKHGCPADIVSDRGSVFTGKFWCAVCGALEMHMSLSTAFHPQSDGSTETVNKLIEQVLRCHTLTKQLDWDENLCMVEFAINNSVHSSLKHTPFFLNYGMHPMTPVVVETLQLSKVPVAVKWTNDMQKALAEAKSFLQAAKDRQKSYADAGRVDIKFAVGEKVLLSTTNLNPKFGCKKLYPKWIGPFVVTMIVNDVAYTVKLPVGMKIHPTFHISLLKPYHDDGRAHPPPEPILIGEELEWEVETVLTHRTRRTGRVMRTEFLIKWKGYGPEHINWEPEKNLTNCRDLIELYWKQQAIIDTVKVTEPKKVTVQLQVMTLKIKKRKNPC
jgi:hypothetical protein